MKRILILTGVPFRARDYRRFGIEILSRHFHVSAMDCTAWLRPEYWKLNSQHRHEFVGYQSVESREQFLSLLDDLSGQAIAIDYLFPGELTRQIRNDLRLRGIPRALVLSSIVPAAGRRGFGKARSILRRAVDALRVAWCQTQLRAFPARPPGDGAEIAILSADTSLLDVRSQAPHKIWAHAFDYDLFLACRDQGNQPTKPYAVLLDQNLVYHPDLKFTGTTPASTEEDYYPPLMRFFERVERLTGYRIIIAAHPRAQYHLRPHLFGKYEVVEGGTAELVRDASLVFAHYSESISFAVLWQKPLVLLTTDNMQRIWIRPFIDKYAALLDVPVVNISTADDNNIDLKRWQAVSEKNYAQFKRRYIKRPDTPDLPIWEIFSGYVERHIT